ncbi:MAG TPA: hypothetical protein VHV74_01565 [Pseudonocardiaceae bacterium]|nr:hypothetical protein [Pseudonocardiaceae bacterium]
MKVDLVAGVTPVSVGSVEQTAHELAGLIADSIGVQAAAWEAASLAHRASAGLLAVVRAPQADPALLMGVLAAGGSRNGLAEAVAGSGSDVRETVTGRTPLGYQVVFAERVVSPDQLRAGEPFDCQLQAVVADPDRSRLAVFTLSSATGRGWLEVSAAFGAVVASVDFRD